MKPLYRSLVITALLSLASAGPGPLVLGQHGGHGAPPAPRGPYTGPYTEKLRVSKEGDVTFSTLTAAGEWLISPGKYRFEHVVEGDEHFVRFERGDATAVQPPIRVRCRLVPLKKPAKRTEIHALVNSGGSRTIEAIQVRGESVKHVF